MKARIFFVFLLYRLLQWIALPAVFLYLSVRAWRQPGYGIGERLGNAPGAANNLRTQPGGIWLHAVSVGEVLSAVRLIGELRVAHPRRPIFVSVGTVAGRELAGRQLGNLADQIFYAPLDYAWCVRRVLRRLRPSLVIILETEIWPNLWNQTAKTGAGLLVINGRLSDRAWPRYQRLAWFFAPILRLPSRILAQDATSAQRYVGLGADPARVQFAGNLKYDLSTRQSAAPGAVIALLERLPSKRVWIAASTMPAAQAGDPDEDLAVIDAFQTLKTAIPNLLLILVPRKPETFDAAAGKLKAAGVPFLRRSELQGTETLALPGALLVDSMGELSSLFRLADAVFMGGTLASRGGHNILEPAFAAKPVIVGPHMENFAEVAAGFRREDAISEIASAEELATAVSKILIEGDGGMGQRGLAVAEAGRGATARAVAQASEVIGTAQPVVVAPWPLRIAAGLWSIGATAHRKLYETGLASTERLPHPVVSIGGISVGGSGKTPLTLWLADQLHQRGLHPAFLTRGYRRQGGEAVTIALRGGRIGTSETGDEAQILIRSGLGPVGIAGDRAAAAQKLLATGQPVDVFLLDDGFQHHRLARNFDLVAIDALDPFAGGRSLPAGRLREPVSALRRASAIVVTRTEPGQNYDAIHRILRQANPRAPIFDASNRAAGWFDLNGRAATVDGVAMAFCGLGNPISFWTSIAQYGIAISQKWEFEDHHRYSAEDLRRMASQARSKGVSYLLTTEKDVMNLPVDIGDVLAGVELRWLKMGLELEQGEALVDLVCQAIQSVPPRASGPV